LNSPPDENGIYGQSDNRIVFRKKDLSIRFVFNINIIGSFAALTGRRIVGTLPHINRVTVCTDFRSQILFSARTANGRMGRMEGSKLSVLMCPCCGDLDFGPSGLGLMKENLRSLAYCACFLRYNIACDVAVR
jgi:hypothetical protein